MGFGRRGLFGTLVVAGAVAGLIAAPSAAAETWLVNENAVNDGNCDATCSLGDAVDDAGSEDTIIITPGTTPFLGDPIELSLDLTIEGQGATESRIRTNDITRVFEVGPEAVITLKQLSIEQGKAPDGDPGVSGDGGEAAGAILAGLGSVLTLDRVLMKDNHAGDGGAASNGNGGNGGDAGAIFSTGDVVITDSTLSKNFAGDGGDAAGAVGAGGNGGDGGAVVIGSPGTLKLTRSTISDNTSGRGGQSLTGVNGGDAGDGGGIYSSGATFTSVNSTIADNATGLQAVLGGAAGKGGGIYEDSSSSATLVSTTVAGNIAIGSFAPSSSGGGIHRGGLGAVTVRNSLIAHNWAFVGRNCGGTVIADGGNNIQFPDLPVLSGCPAGFEVADPRLGLLSSNGGPTQTMALGAGSAAIDQVPTSGCTDAALIFQTSDQRGPGFARPSGPACDIGSFESQAVPVSEPPAAQPPSAVSPAVTVKKCKKGRKLRKGKCVKVRRKK